MAESATVLSWGEVAEDPAFRKEFLRSPFILALDFDGTLAPFVPERLAARLHPELLPVLEDLAAHPSVRLVFVTGRPALELRSLLELSRPVEIWGSHGAERLDLDGLLSRQPLTPSQSAGLAEARVLAGRMGLGGRCEVKHAGLAAHWRGLPRAEARRMDRALNAAWGDLAGEADLELRAFDGGLELRPRGVNKGRPIRALLEEAGGASRLVYLGDDQTDEDAFAALAGRGLPVLVAEWAWPTAARLRLTPRTEVREFLALVLGLAGDRPSPSG
jgi:trehalose 6-phosphate synthase/trehalose 6-phosphate phosphatase